MTDPWAIERLDARIRAEMARQTGRKVQGTTTIREAQPMTAATGAVAVPASEDNDEIIFYLEPVQLAWREYTMWHGQAAEAKRFMDQFKAELAKLARDANTLYLSGRQVATYKRDAKLNLGDLNREHPEIVERYTHFVTEEKFDEALFRKEMPEMHAAYRGRSLRLTP